MLTEKDYCDYNTCVALKELGFDWDFEVSLWKAQKWLREERKIEVVVLGENEIGGPYYADVYDSNGYAEYTHKSYEKYEEALLRGIKKAIKLLKEN